jgi:Na+/melibiose symporter-like transporter
MKAETVQTRNVIFWVRNVIFAILVILALILFSSFNRLGGHKVLYLVCALLALAAALIMLTIKLKEPGIRKYFLILTGVSAAGVPICVILHNLVFAFCVKYNCIYWSGSDEPVFFILAIFVCPALFFLGVLGSITLLVTTRLRKKS